MAGLGCETPSQFLKFKSPYIIIILTKLGKTEISTRLSKDEIETHKCSIFCVCGICRLLWACSCMRRLEEDVECPVLSSPSLFS